VPSPSKRGKALSICTKVIVESICFFNQQRPHPLPKSHRKQDRKVRYVIESSDSEDDYERPRRHYKYVEKYRRPKRYRRTVVVEESDEGQGSTPR
jgi:hypothetical protein